MTIEEAAADARAKINALVKIATGQRDSHNVNNVEKFVALLDAAAAANLGAAIFPRHASAANDARIERLVNALQDSVIMAEDIDADLVQVRETLSEIKKKNLIITLVASKDE